MLSHERIWAAIDTLAKRHSMTPSGLARRAGLDATTFNKSKRTGADGRPRWPSTESIAKIVDATESSVVDFFAAIPGMADLPKPKSSPLNSVPLLGLAEAGGGGFFDDSGFPVGQGWDEIALPYPSGDEPLYALEVSGQSMTPLYREGDIIVVSPGAAMRRGDRVVVRTKAGEVMAKVLQRRTAKTLELASINPEFPDLQFAVDDVEWVARIVWASQ